MRIPENMTSNKKVTCLIYEKYNPRTGSFPLATLQYSACASVNEHSCNHIARWTVTVSQCRTAVRLWNSKETAVTTSKFLSRRIEKGHINCNQKCQSLVLRFKSGTFHSSHSYTATLGFSWLRIPGMPSEYTSNNIIKLNKIAVMTFCSFY
jgi:hypothetical protein